MSVDTEDDWGDGFAYMIRVLDSEDEGNGVTVVGLGAAASASSRDLISPTTPSACCEQGGDEWVTWGDDEEQLGLLSELPDTGDSSTMCAGYDSGDSSSSSSGAVHTAGQRERCTSFMRAAGARTAIALSSRALRCHVPAEGR